MGEWLGAVDVAASVERFGTVVFGDAYMTRVIPQSFDASGSLDASTWFHLVPECYREMVASAVSRAFARHRGRPGTREAAARVVADVCREIWNTVKPVRGS